MEFKDSAKAAIGVTLFILSAGIVTGGIVFYVVGMAAALFIAIDYYRLYDSLQDLRQSLAIKRGFSRRELFLGSTTQLIYRFTNGGKAARKIKVDQRLDDDLHGNGQWKPVRINMGSSVFFKTILEPLRSGVFTISPPDLIVESLLFTDSFSLGVEQQIMVYLPIGDFPQRLGAAGLRAKKDLSIFDSSESSRGCGMDFLSIRRYVGGDNLKRIDWVRSSRMNELMVREYEDDKPLPLFFLIDVDPSMAIGGDESGLMAAKSLTAAVINNVLANGERIGAACFSSSGVVHYMHAGIGPDHMHDLRGMISSIEPAGVNNAIARHDQGTLPYDLKNTLGKDNRLDEFVGETLKGYMANIKDDGFSKAIQSALRSLNTQSRIIVITDLSMGMASLLNGVRIAKYYGHHVSIVLLPHVWHEDLELVDVEAKGDLAKLKAHGIDAAIMYPGERAEDVIRQSGAINIKARIRR